MTPGEAPHPLAERLPLVLGPCLLERELGSGSMGSVFAGRLVATRSWLEAGRPVAVKVLHPALRQAAGAFQARFEREAAIGASVVHPAVVRTYAAEEATVDGVAHSFLVLELAEGQTLRALLDQLGVLPEPLLRALGAQVARGLEAVHGASVLHRDLKPENVLITPDHQVKLMDLGVARLLDDDRPLTRMGEFVGSPAYAAPEQFGDERLGPAADLYALGAVLYESATGVQPFLARGFHAIMRRHLELVPRPASELNPQLTPFLDDLLATLLEKDPARRPATAREVAERLERGETSAWGRERARARRSSLSRPLPRNLRVSRETALLGREEALAALREAFEAASEGSGGLVLVEGEPGVGKTRLVDEFLRGLGTACEPVAALYGSNAPGGLFGSRGALAEAVLEHFGSESLEARILPFLSDTRRMAPAFAAQLLGTPLPPGVEPLVSDALHAAFCDLARGLAARHPVVWVVEDLHFASVDIRALLASLARIAHDRRLLLVATTRSAPTPAEAAELERLERFRRIPLGRLSARDVIRLLAQALRSEVVAERLGGVVALKSDGNPYFVFELLRELKERAVLRPSGASWDADPAAIESFEVPSSIQEMFRARLKELDERDRDLLDVAAVQGFAFDPDLCARVLGRRRLEVLQGFARIERRSGVVRATGAGFEFDHHQLQETIFQALPPLLRSEYHALLASAFEEREGLKGLDPEELPGAAAVFLAQHWLRGGRPQEGLRLARRAAEELHAAYRNEALLGFVELAISAVGDGDAALRADLRLLESACLDRMGRREPQRRAIADALEAAARSGDPRRLARARLEHGTLSFRCGNLLEAEERLRLALGEAGTCAEPRTQAVALSRLGIVLLSLGRHQEARDSLERAVEIARAHGIRHVEAGAAGNLGNVFWVTGAYHRARAAYEQQLALGRELGDRMLETVATGNLGSVLFALGSLEQAHTHGLRYVELSRQIANAEGEAIGALSLAEIALVEGAFAEAERRLQEGSEKARVHGLARVQSWAETLRAQLLEARGDLEAALATIDGVLDSRPENFERTVEAMALFLLGRLLLGSGRRDEAVRRLTAAERLSTELRLGAPGPLPSAYLAWIGERPVAAVEVAARHPATVRAETHLVLYRAGGLAAHLDAARELLERLSAHLPEAARAGFWSRNPVARTLGELTAR